MAALLKLAEFIDTANERISRIANWLVLLACVVSAGNATIRYTFNSSSNAWMELQWYMFAGMVMLGTSYTLKMNEHVRVDVLYGRLEARTRAWVDLLGCIFFLMPAMLLLAWLSWPFFYNSFISSETVGNAGSLMLWPAKLALALGFTLLSLQGCSEIIKRIGYLTGQYNMDTHYERPLQ